MNRTALAGEVKNLLVEVGDGRMASTAYDTAWVAMLAKDGYAIGERALDWLRENQLPDGTWGVQEPVYYYDRLVSTLAAIIAFSVAGDLIGQDAARVFRAQSALQSVLPNLTESNMMETIGAEVLIPSLFDVVEEYNLGERWHDAEYERLMQQRERKLSRLPSGMINRKITLNFSAEMAGSQYQHLLDVKHLQEENGSIGDSPAATAYFLQAIDPGNAEALAYLEKTANPEDGGFPNVYPFDMFELSWALWNLDLAGIQEHADLLAQCQQHLDFIENAWDPEQGAAFAANYGVLDGDGTSMAYEVLARYGRDVQVDPVFNYERETHFVTYPNESNLSLSVNIHVLSALKFAGYQVDDASVAKIRKLLEDQKKGAFWSDKWHHSPYYTTSHIIITAADYMDDLAENAVQWILETQNANGSWGFQVETVEETAYCLQALCIWHKAGHAIPSTSIQRGQAWLRKHYNEPYHSLWIGKCLYQPTRVIRSAALSALLLSEKVLER
ncbi:MAG: hypothetical protein KC496_03895 [Anaerolineae bacterium]|nr:hypothetical protein [Anaerolineae bacterium]